MTDRGKYPDDEDLVQEEGVFVPAEGGRRVGCDEDEEPCAPDDMVEDPINDEGVPGTPDDLPYDYGAEVPPAADQQLTSIDDPAGIGDVGQTGAPPDKDAPELGRPEERELWRKQKALIEESGDEAARYAGIPEEEVPRLEDAAGDESAEVRPDAPGGTSATGSVTEE